MSPRQGQFQPHAGGQQKGAPRGAPECRTWAGTKPKADSANPVPTLTLPVDFLPSTARILSGPRPVKIRRSRRSPSLGNARMARDVPAWPQSAATSGSGTSRSGCWTPNSAVSLPTAACCVFVSECRYLAVVCGSGCPSSSWTVRMSTPLRMRWVAKVWRSWWGVMPLPFEAGLADHDLQHPVNAAAMDGVALPRAQSDPTGA